MAEALGVTPEVEAKIDATMEVLIKEQRSQIEIVEHIRDNMQLDNNQFCAFMFALGYYVGRKNIYQGSTKKV